MRILIQRVSEAKVLVEKQVVAHINNGLLILVGFGNEDDANKLPLATKKVLELRIFGDEKNKMNLSVKDTNGSLLLVPQFTLYADCRRGRRPDFTAAAPPVLAENLFNMFTASMKETGIEVQTGVFGAYMEVSLVNDGPVTIFMEF
ncbi:MAG TPA: D-aminoacyl-tRNA deacylase [Candidatus Syntrophosphaera sp.]|jgi:D-tyrosyl-tRNA(Tyr) deacylase|nr:MAG: D-tyrosyl-tRNA(Tyr) deacylase [Candidatus Cloacimonetes bacterium ADurb.Bin211]HOD60225.1 D-aminoacyl-tRNA deacylase [Candidatus Syntrophosphaera sp.]HQM79900.1 D-aminoacyl-tRNA deacylase [Candidatus Syntrophosphaera sp.]